MTPSRREEPAFSRPGRPITGQLTRDARVGGTLKLGKFLKIADENG